MMKHYPFDDGLTFVRKKCEYDFKSKVENWDRIFSIRKDILECVIKYKNKASEYCDGEGLIWKDNIRLDFKLDCLK
jgi:hypothetical protein